MKKSIVSLVTILVIFVLAGCPQTTDGGTSGGSGGSSGGGTGGDSGGGSGGGGSVILIPNGDFSKGQVVGGDNAGAGIDWVYDIVFGAGEPFVDEWSQFSINDEENKQFLAGTAASLTNAIEPANISQVVTLEAGTYTAELQITSSWAVVDGDTVKIEVLDDGGTSLAISEAINLNTWVSGGDWILVKTPEFTLADGVAVTVKITFDIKTASAGTTIDDVVFRKF